MMANISRGIGSRTIARLYRERGRRATVNTVAAHAMRFAGERARLRLACPVVA